MDKYLGDYDNQKGVIVSLSKLFLTLFCFFNLEKSSVRVNARKVSKRCENQVR